ncbi:MAG: hypothetical protein [Olavius algarvensis Gamma 3 endosymbiont]|nr:MAG: hypothetical protein [Olavius algarvensis Gamma 3 endosymbiont]
MGGAGTIRYLTSGSFLCRVLILLLALAGTGAQAEPLRILSQNLNRFFDDVDDGNNEKVLSHERFRQRVKAAAETFGQDFGLPHIIALQEVENRNALAQIAAEIRARYDARYRLLLIPGQDFSGINLAYLVRDDIEIRHLDQLFRDETFGNDANPLFTRPPLLLEACYIGNCLSLLNLHLRSMRGIDNREAGEPVRRKRLAQAESIASWSNRQQQSDPELSLLILGDLNALTPSDRHVDVAGIIRGQPDNKKAKLRGRDLVQPNLVDLTLLIPPTRRYSYIYRQRKQLLDYMLVNQAFAAEVEFIAFNRIEPRFSDHAGLLARFKW